jgi:2-polyprenyl-3-methyl-5-hydroxy-6-metoxy-1,4-benzoquinol methylase
MENNTNNSEKAFDKAFAMAWNEHQGGYSQNLAKKVLKFIKLQDLNVNTVLDVCCGSANFLSEMKANGKMCTGTEILDSYVEYNKNKYPNMSFFRTNAIDDLENLGIFTRSLLHKECASTFICEMQPYCYQQ